MNLFWHGIYDNIRLYTHKDTIKWEKYKINSFVFTSEREYLRDSLKDTIKREKYKIIFLFLLPSNSFLETLSQSTIKQEKKKLLFMPSVSFLDHKVKYIWENPSESIL